MEKILNLKRREFVKKSSLAAIGSSVLGNPSWSKNKNERLRVGIVGCGERGAGAIVNALAVSDAFDLVAMGDTFKDRLDKCYADIQPFDKKGQIKVEEKNKFVGFDAYEKVIEESDVVFLVTPAPFRPMHFEAAVNAGKHIFMEKPLAVDVPGYHKIMEINKLADEKKLNVVVGLQMRYKKSFQELISKIWDDEIGRVVSIDVYFNVGAPRIHPRQPGQTEMEYQMRNWRYFTWLWGGQLAGQTIHQMDVMNWMMKDYPVSAKGLGGRQTFSGPNQGNTWDHHFTEFEYPNGTKMHVQSFTMNKCWGRMGFFVQGTRGSADERNRIYDLDKNVLWNWREDEPNEYEVEHDVLFKSILNGKHVNDTEYGAKSTLTTIMGRMAMHSGRIMTIEDVLQSEKSLLPEKFTWDAEMPDLPDANGNYTVPMPGMTKVL
ncbi:MAG: Gfo/Idh/MocA family oxidoreductase [Cyclobacteriaceae bacterium]|jgi:predicted dehydrogenase